MSISVHRASVVVFKRMLRSLDGVLGKAVEFVESRKIEPNALLYARLAPDMFHLIRQVQSATDQAKRVVGQLAGVEPPKAEGDEKSFADLRARIASTVAFLDSIQPEQLEGADAKEITIPVGGQTLKLSGADFLLGFGTPNVFFHITTAYAILRHNGVPIGKRDFIGGR